ncbi:unannotated protein [freshwater metagenome]|uniref:Unannotated protein n=1 Tax=freshwater metagenome TaxID=449393 RepID=A0A6J6BX40_9ZZZZ
MTRKGLAVGAGLGLVSSLLVGTAPAFANETLALSPTSGTSYKVLTTTDFDLTVGFAGNESSQAVDTVKYLISNPSGATMAFDVIANGSAAGTVFDRVPGSTTDAAATATSVVVGDGTADVIGARSGINVSITPVEATSANITVRAFLDINGNDSMDDNEARSPARTIEFIDHAIWTGRAVLDTAVVGGTTLSAYVLLDGINYHQLDSNDVQVEFFRDNVAIASPPAGETSPAVTGGTATVAQRTNPNIAVWSSADGELRATLTPDSNTVVDAVMATVANVSTSVYSARVRLYDGTAWQVVANSTNGVTPTSGQISALAAITETASVSTDGSDNIRVGAGTFTSRTTATVNAGFALAGQAVTFTISEASANSIATAASITAGGKTLTNSNIASTQRITVDVVTNALGRASVDISYTGIAAGNTFTVTASALNTNAAVTTSAVTYTAVLSDVAFAQSNVKAGSLQTVVGQSFSVTWNIVDTFGQVPVGTYRLVLGENSSSANYAQTINFVNGAATLTQTENSTAANTYTLSAAVEQQNADGSWDATPSAGDAAVAANVTVQAYTADPTVTTVTVSASATGIGAAADLALELDSTYSGDRDLLRNSVAFPTLVDVSTLTYTVRSSTGEALVGEPITVSAAGLQFAAESDTWFGVGSIAGTTNASGQFVVKVYSNLAGSQTVTATAGGVSRTQELVFQQAKDDTGFTLTLSAPTNAPKGSTFKVTATLRDEFGNLVTTSSTATNFNDGTTAPTFNMTYTGPGLIVGALPTATVNGLAEFSVLLGANDTGSISVTASYDADGTGTASAAVAASASVAVGSAPVSTTGKVNVGSFNGKLVVYAANLNGARISWKVGGNWGTGVASSNYSIFNRPTPRAGATVSVDIYVNGVKTLTKSVVTR